MTTGVFDAGSKSGSSSVCAVAHGRRRCDAKNTGRSVRVEFMVRPMRRLSGKVLGTEGR
jgi:hypothetical protein